MSDPNSPSQQLVGAVLNQRWKLLRLLGEGGMGAVFEADSMRGEGKRAVKLLHPEFSKEEQILQRFFAEAQTSQSLQHPNIARTFESARAEDGTPYLVMELLQGQPLANWIDAGTPIPPQQAGPIIHGVLQALHLAHQRRIVHRDLKPDNLFMTRDQSGQYVVKVLDFGIAKVMDAAGGMGNKTRTGVLLGTPGYMSPEQIKNSKAVDARSDLWAVGVIFYEMLTCRLPYDAPNEFARLTAVLSEDPKPIEQVAPHLQSWSGFFRKAIASEASDRFQTAEEMANAIMMVLRGGSLAGTSTAASTAPPAPNATVALAAVPDWNAPSPAPAQAPATRPGTGTVPSVPSPATFQGNQPSPAHAAPATYPGAQAASTAISPSVHSPAPLPQRQPSNTYQSAQPVHIASIPMAPMAGEGRQNNTHVSAHAPPGVQMPSSPPPNVQVIDAPPLPKGTVPVWIVGAVGGACLVVGFLIGFLVAR
ncbi:MAG: protein kinase [Polyangiaceae bacterium]